MKRTILMTAVALAFAASAPASFAAGASIGADTNVGVDTNAGAGANVGAGANASTSTGTSSDPIVTGSTSTADAGSLASTIAADGTTAAAIKSMDKISSVTVVKVTDVAKGDNQQTVTDALTKNKSVIANLQASISANSQLKAKLDEKSIKVSSVVALNVAAGGAVTVYVD